MKYIVTGKNYISPLLLKLGRNPAIKIIPEDVLAKSKIIFSQSDVLYIPSESSLQIVMEHMADKGKLRAISTLKDKFSCRKLLKPLYPDLYFRKVPLEDLDKFNFNRGKKYCIKPQKGFFSCGVRIIDNKTDIKKIQHEISRELTRSGMFFSETVLSKKDMIIEEYIGGEEYAVDMFYDEKREPVVMNIYHHPQAANPAYSNVLYYTSKNVFKKMQKKIEEFFIEFNRHLRVKTIPLHGEFRIYKNNIVPIEINPVRYGGFGLADLTYYAFGLDPFKAFFNNFKPNWNDIWKNHDGYFGWVLGYNGVNTDVNKKKPKHKAFKSLFKEILHYVKFDYSKNPAFAIAYVKEDQKKRLFKLLEIDFDKYFA